MYKKNILPIILFKHYLVTKFEIVINKKLTKTLNYYIIKFLIN